MSYSLIISDEQMEFLRQLFQSQIAVTLATVEIVSDLKRMVMHTLPTPTLPPTPATAPMETGTPD